MALEVDSGSPLLRAASELARDIEGMDRQEKRLRIKVLARMCDMYLEALCES